MRPVTVYLAEADAGTPNACWVVCAKGDPGAVEFHGQVPERIRCGCSYTFPLELGAYGCPNCQGDNGDGSVVVP